MKSDRLKALFNEDTVMSANARDIKHALHTLADQLPEDATWKDVVYEAYVRQEIEAGLSEARRGEFASADEVQETFAKWGMQASGQRRASKNNAGTHVKQAASAAPVDELKTLLASKISNPA